MTTAPGLKTLAVVEYVAAHPGCTKADAGGWYPVERAIRRGLVREEAGPGGTCKLFAADADRA